MSNPYAPCVSTEAAVPGRATRFWLGALGLGLGLGAAAVAEAISYPTGSRWLAGALSLLTAAAVVLRPWSPRLMTIAVVAGLLALTFVGIGETPMWAFVELLAVSFWTTESLPSRDARVGVTLLVVVGMAFDFRSGENSAGGSIVSPLVIVGAPALAGALLRRSREHAARLQTLTAELAEQRDKAARVAEFAERARIAREIHDVVAHSVSVMLVQAGAAQNLLSPEHPATAPVTAVRATGKQALAELRRVVGVLRSAAGDDTHPQPTLAALPDLVAEARGAGTSVEVSVDADTIDALPEGVQLTAFRVIQEALTNARKHAPDAAVHIIVRCDDARLLVRVDDDGPACVTGDASGFGLLGLRERAELYDGDLFCGPQPSGQGWRVELSIPLAASSVQAAS